MALYADAVFAPLDLDLHLERIAGGNETEVYRTDDAQYVVKVKSEEAGSDQAAWQQAKTLQAAAAEFAAAVGPRHSIENAYFVARNSQGQAQVVAVQPFLSQAIALHDIDYTALTPQQRRKLAKELRNIIKLSLKMYLRNQVMPDIYGRTSSSKAERKFLNQPYMLPWRLWSFIIKRNLLRSHNLMLTADQQRVVLVDYDPVQRSKLYKLIYYTVRRLLFWRDYALIWLMEKKGFVPN